MKQILQDTRSGHVAVFEVPRPMTRDGHLLVRTRASLISSGTEKMAVDSGQKSLLGRARERPDLVKQVIERVKTEGLLNTYAAVQSKLANKTPLGYSAAGEVIGVGPGVSGYAIGDRVACAGVGYASHAEVISVPVNLCSKVPASVGNEEAAFSTLGAIALQGVRLATPTLGESVAVIGLGLLGQITVQLLKANGCRVLGIDIDETKFERAAESGADLCSQPSDAATAAEMWSRGRGVDAVVITAGTTSNEPIELAGEIARLKGRVVVVGMIGLNVPRGPYFAKELSLQVSMSYGPGRYDASYEERGLDYPFAYVRWTEGRNLEAFLDLVAGRRIDVQKLITHRFAIEDGETAYRLISGETREPYLGIVIGYSGASEPASRVLLRQESHPGQAIRIGLIGAGDYARTMILPNLKANNVDLRVVATASGVSAKNVGEQFGFREAVSSAHEVINEPEVNLVVIATRHDSHAKLAADALAAGKHVFVEKPLALNETDLDLVMAAAAASTASLMVGFNRRSSPAAREAKAFFSDYDGPVSVLCRVNAGRIATDHWTQDPKVGGGRIIGEVCHFVDLLQFLTGSRPVRVFAQAVASRSAKVVPEDSIFATLKFADGSNGSIAYLAEGDKAMAKERIEIFGGGRTFVIDDFRSTLAYRDGKETVRKGGRQDKGQAEEIRQVCTVVANGGDPPISLDDLALTTLTTFRILASLRSGEPVEI